VVGRFVDIGRIVDHHCLNFLMKTEMHRESMRYKQKEKSIFLKDTIKCSRWSILFTEIDIIV
jgi:hypothetical protein